MNPFDSLCTLVTILQSCVCFQSPALCNTEICLSSCQEFLNSRSAITALLRPISYQNCTYNPMYYSAVVCFMYHFLSERWVHTGEKPYSVPTIVGFRLHTGEKPSMYHSCVQTCVKFIPARHKSSSDTRT